MPPSPTESVRAYRAIGLFVGAALVAFVVLFRSGDAPGVDALVGLWLVAAAAGALVAATFAGPAVYRHLRTATYLLFLLSIGVVSWLAYRNAFDVPYAIGLVFLLSAVGLGGFVTSSTLRWTALCIGFAIVLPLLGLLLTPDPLVDPLAYGAALLANGVAVLLIVRNRVDTRLRLEGERERYRNLFDRAAEGIYLADAETLQILDANPAYLALTGRTLEEVRALRIPDLIAPESRPGPIEAIAAATAEPGATFAGSHQHRTASGERIDVDVSVSSLMYAGRRAFSVIVRDATLQRQTERGLDDAREHAEQLLQLKNALLSNMSHEVRTPLTGIMGYAELLRHELEGDQLSYTEAIAESAQRLHETLETILHLAEVQSGNLDVQLEPIDLADAARRAVAEFAAMATDKGVELVAETPDTAVRVLADREALQQALRQLVDNAVKFTNEGAVRLTIQSDGAFARLSVADTGIGVPESFLPNLFESFQQASVGVKRTHQGAGLGLALARRLMESMRGTIEVTSEEGVGSVFTIVVPLMPSGDSGVGDSGMRDSRMGELQRRRVWPDAERPGHEAPSPAGPVQ